MWFKGWILGTAELQLLSADAQRIVDRLLAAEIELLNVHWIDEMTVRFVVYKNDFSTVLKLVEKHQGEIELIKQAGVLIYCKNIIHRPILIFGILAVLLLSIYIPRRIFFVQVSGNEKISDEEIIEKAELCGLSFGMSRKSIRSEQVKNLLLEELPLLQWVGINTSGCVATICIKERSVSSKPSEADVGPASIVASIDGFIRSVVSTRGTVLCQSGQAVTEGQVLISGYTDCGSALVITRAEGEVYADTSRDFEIITLNSCVNRGRKISSEQRASILFGKKLINLYKGSGILDTTCVKIYEKYHVGLPGGFVLPVKLQLEKIEYYECEELHSENAEEPWLLLSADSYLKNQMIAGTILDRQSTVIDEEEVFGYSLQYSCIEMIGQIRKEELFNLHGENG